MKKSFKSFVILLAIAAGLAVLSFPGHCQDGDEQPDERVSVAVHDGVLRYDAQDESGEILRFAQNDGYGEQGSGEMLRYAQHDGPHAVIYSFASDDPRIDRANEVIDSLQVVIDEMPSKGSGQGAWYGWIAFAFSVVLNIVQKFTGRKKKS